MLHQCGWVAGLAGMNAKQVRELGFTYEHFQ